ncbi:MAG TPA: fatty acid desaturase, partial [Tepidisphaeraceae bacterium]
MSETPVYRKYRRTLLSPQRVRELSQLRPAVAVRDTALCWLVIFACWIGVAVYPAWWTVLLAVVIIGTQAYALMILAHDGLHRRLFNGVRANDLFNDLCIVGSFGAITRINNRNHLSHHQHLGSHEDPDRYKYICINKSTGLELLSYLIGAQVFVSIHNVLLGRRERTKAAVKSAKPGYVVRDLAILIGWQAMLWTLGCLFIGWWAVPVLWYLPFFLFALLGDNFRTFAEHTVVGADHDADDHRLITYVSNPIERLFFSPMNMNFHTAHHLWTSIPYYNLPTADAEIR